jgi:uncharacterized OB-fold protein
MSAHKPVPKPNEVTQPYWDSLKRSALSVQRCKGCGTLRNYPRLVCDRCYSVECDWVDLSGRGKVHSWTITHHAFHPSFKEEVPYVLVIVDLDEGVRMMGRLRGAADEKISIGMPVQFAVDQREDGWAMPAFART